MYYGNGLGSIYDPASYPAGVPNPFVPRVHAWGEGPWPEEGTRYHGPVYTRPMWAERWQGRPMNGLGAVPDSASWAFGIAGAAVGIGIGGIVAERYSGMAASQHLAIVLVPALVLGVIGAFAGNQFDKMLSNTGS